MTIFTENEGSIWNRYWHSKKLMRF
jgi:hypothetical protein